MTQFKDISQGMFTTGDDMITQIWVKVTDGTASCVGVIVVERLGGLISFEPDDEVKVMTIES